MYGSKTTNPVAKVRMDGASYYPECSQKLVHVISC